MNLYDETIETLLLHGKCTEDIRYIRGSTGMLQGDNQIFEISLADFIRVAKSYDYNDGYGSAEVPMDLYICGEDWWLERKEYDGAEEWSFKTMPQRPAYKRELEAIVGKDDFPRCVFKGPEVLNEKEVVNYPTQADPLRDEAVNDCSVLLSKIKAIKARSSDILQLICNDKKTAALVGFIRLHDFIRETTSDDNIFNPDK